MVIKSTTAARTVRRTTFPVAVELLELLDGLVASGRFPTRASALELALRRLAWDLEEEGMFQAFESAGKDADWRAEQVALAEEASSSSWEALKLGEQGDEQE